MKISDCYRGSSRIPQLYEAGATGGVATTLALAALELDVVEGMVVSHCYGTYVARSLKDLVKSCGSIYENYRYENHNGHKLGQIGKPCNINNNYDFKISLFCSHVAQPQKEIITKDNRPTVSRMHTPVKCWLCRDHVGVDSDISVGDTQTDPKENVLIIRSNRGRKVLKYAMKEDMICLESMPFQEIVKKQPYLWRWWRKCYL